MRVMFPRRKFTNSFLAKRACRASWATLVAMPRRLVELNLAVIGVVSSTGGGVPGGEHDEPVSDAHSSSGWEESASVLISALAVVAESNWSECVEFELTEKKLVRVPQLGV